MPTIATTEAFIVDGVATSALEQRLYDTAIFLGDGSNNGIRGGICFHGPTSLGVTVNGSDQVTVQAGACVIPAGTGLGVWRGTLAAATSAVALTARNATNPRIDLIVAQATGTNLTVKTIDGTPAASPVAPALPAQHIELARVTVPPVAGGAVTVDSSWRTFATALGGRLLVPTVARLPGSGNTLGQEATALDTGTEYYWNGSAWLNNGNPIWSQFSPTLSGTGTTQGNIAFTTREYVVNPGNLVDFYAKVTLGSTTIMGSVNYIALPVALLNVDSIVSMSAIYNDASGSSYAGFVRAFDTAKVLLYSGTTLAPVTSTVPFTWVSGDSIELRGTLRGAL